MDISAHTAVVAQLEAQHSSEVQSLLTSQQTVESQLREFAGELDRATALNATYRDEFERLRTVIRRELFDLSDGTAESETESVLTMSAGKHISFYAICYSNQKYRNIISCFDSFFNTIVDGDTDVDIQSKLNALAKERSVVRTKLTNLVQLLQRNSSDPSGMCVCVCVEVTHVCY